MFRFHSTLPSSWSSLPVAIALLPPIKSLICSSKIFASLKEDLSSLFSSFRHIRNSTVLPTPSRVKHCPKSALICHLSLVSHSVYPVVRRDILGDCSIPIYERMTRAHIPNSSAAASPLDARILHQVRRHKQFRYHQRIHKRHPHGRARRFRHAHPVDGTIEPRAQIAARGGIVAHFCYFSSSTMQDQRGPPLSNQKKHTCDNRGVC